MKHCISDAVYARKVGGRPPELEQKEKFLIPTSTRQVNDKEKNIMAMTKAERKKYRKNEDYILQTYKEADSKEAAFYKYLSGLSREEMDIIGSDMRIDLAISLAFSSRFQEERDSYMDMKPLELAALLKEMQTVVYEWLKEDDPEKCIQAKYTGPRGDVVIQEGTEEIEEEAFVEFGRMWQEGFLTSVTISEGVVEIGDKAFRGCWNLTEAAIPASVRKIGSGAFSDCEHLTAIRVEAGNRFYSAVGGLLLNRDGSVLLGYPSGKAGALSIPGSVTEIGGKAFYGCSGLTEAAIPEGVSKIGDRAFGNCENLASVTIPESVAEIGDFAFTCCRSLNGVTIPESVTEISDYAFAYCVRLNSAVIPGSIKRIGKGAFELCRCLASVTIPEGVDEIDDKAFCYSVLTSVAIPESVRRIGKRAFERCVRLASVTIPEGVREIGSGAFSGCRSLTRVIIPESVEIIGERAFEGCTGLTEVIIPERFRERGGDIFPGCESLNL